jgi:hypothetical protein
MLVHLDEVVDPTGGRATLNEIFTALKWFTLIVPEATVEDSGNAVDQLSAALAAIEGAVLFKTLATVSADGAVELKAAAFKELAASACHALRPMDVQYLCALVGGRTGWTLEELRAHLDKCRQFKKLLRRTQVRFAVCVPYGGRVGVACATLLGIALMMRRDHILGDPQRRGLPVRTLTVDCHVSRRALRQDLRSGDKQKALAAAGEEADDDQAGLPRLNAINALMQVSLPALPSIPPHFDEERADLGSQRVKKRSERRAVHMASKTDVTILSAYPVTPQLRRCSALLARQIRTNEKM